MQIAILNSRGVATDKSTPKVLAREGYYSVVNGYKDLYLAGLEVRRAAVVVAEQVGEQRIGLFCNAAASSLSPRQARSA